MRITVTYYLDVISSWCFFAEPAWAELKKRYEGKAEFQWRIALLDKIGLPASREQEQWFYRRSGTIMRSPFMLSSDWFEPGRPEYLAPNCVAEAAKDFGITEDRVRLALAYAGLREGKHFGDWKIAAEIGAKAANLDAKELLERARSTVVEKSVEPTEQWLCYSSRLKSWQDRHLIVTIFALPARKCCLQLPLGSR